MRQLELLKEIKATYERHGWSLRRVLLRPETAIEIESSIPELLPDIDRRESNFDALWFARASHAKREAWELRFLAEQPYALFEAFEADESEEDREDARREMENRMRQHVMR